MHFQPFQGAYILKFSGGACPWSPSLVDYVTLTPLKWTPSCNLAAQFSLNNQSYPPSPPPPPRLAPPASSGLSPRWIAPPHKKNWLWAFCQSAVCICHTQDWFYKMVSVKHRLWKYCFHHANEGRVEKTDPHSADYSTDYSADYSTD